MAKICPITKDWVLYPECMDCEEKVCRQAQTEDTQSSPSENKPTKKAKKEKYEKK